MISILVRYLNNLFTSQVLFPLMDLPPEIIREIISYLGNRSYRNLLLANKQFNVLNENDIKQRREQFNIFYLYPFLSNSTSYCFKFYLAEEIHFTKEHIERLKSVKLVIIHTKNIKNKIINSIYATNGTVNIHDYVRNDLFDHFPIVVPSCNVTHSFPLKYAPYKSSVFSIEGAFMNVKYIENFRINVNLNPSEILKNPYREVKLRLKTYN